MFVASDAGDPSSETKTPTIADLDKDQAVITAHDQIYLAAATGEISSDIVQSLILEIDQGRLLDGCPGPLR